MKATEGATGLVLIFGSEDENILNNGGQLKTKVSGKPQQEVTVQVQDEVVRQETDFMGEPGLRTISKPPGYDSRLKYEIWMDKKIAKKLIENGYAGCRCMYGRLDMTYREESAEKEGMENETYR